MTHKNKFSELTRSIRDTLPRLMNIEKGCLFYEKNPEKETLKEILEVKDFEIIINNDSVYFGNIESFKENKKFKIIGKEPMFNDVLDYIKKITPSESDLSKPFYFIVSSWDLSNPYLKGQDEDIVNYLLEVKKLNIKI